MKVKTLKKLGEKAQKGFSLIVVLMLVTTLAGVLTGIVVDSRDSSIRKEAQIAGWEATKIARAARVFVRDLTSADPNLSATLDPVSGTGPQDIPLASLINNAMLPQNFARLDSGEYFNALGQRIRVIMANFPVDGDPTLSTTVPTAYVLFEDNDKSNASIIQDIVQEARRQEVAVGAPIFSGGVNISGDCNGRGDSVVIWDTGCIGAADYLTLTGVAYQEGDFVLPAWRSVNFDARVLMRFAQPENTGLPTMLTELEMATPYDCEADPTLRIEIPSDDPAAPAYSDICQTIADDAAAGIDNRRDILNTRSVDAVNLLTHDQAGDDVLTDNVTGLTSARADDAFALSLSGNLDGTGDTKIHGGDLTVTGDLTAGRNITVTRNNAGPAVTARAGTITTGNTSSGILNVINRPDVTGDISVQNGVLISGTSTIQNGFVARSVQMSGGNPQTVTVNGSADLLGVNQFDSVAIDGSAAVGGFSYVTGEMTMNNAIITGDVNASDSIAFLGDARASTINVTDGSGGAECLDDCPQRELEAFCSTVTGISQAECFALFGEN